MRKNVLAAALAVVLPALLVSGCDSSSSGAQADGGSTRSATSSAHSLVVNVTVHGKAVTPNGDRLNAKVGQPVIIHVTSDRAGELHVHSTPEQELSYGKGKTTLKVTIDKPGVVDIEDHVADVVVVQLAVS